MTAQERVDRIAQRLADLLADQEMTPEEVKEENRHIEQELKWIVIGAIGISLVALGAYIGWAVLVNSAYPHCITPLGGAPVCK